MMALYEAYSFLNVFQFNRVEKSLLNTNNCHKQSSISSSSISSSAAILPQKFRIRPISGGISDFDFDSSDEVAEVKSDLELGKTHGYEGDFKIGDKVRIKSDIRLWHVKEYSKEGFLCKGYEGVVIGFDLYGRKVKSLCSAITPVKVEFLPDGNGVPPGECCSY